MSKPVRAKGNEPSADGRAPWWMVALAAVALGALLLAYFWLRTSPHLEWHGLIGDALAPVGSLLSLFAVLAALWSVHVQRRELALQREELGLQRKELQDNRAEMKAQREQFERTAKAQESLAAAQLAANQLAPFQELATRRMTLASLYDLVLRADIQSNRAEGTAASLVRIMKEARQVAQQRITEEGARILELEEQLGIKHHTEADP
jgi:hypothetical protein